MIYKNKLITSILYKVNAITVSPLSIKDGEDSLIVNESTGKAFIPGSSIAGAFRNYYENYICRDCNDDSSALFGGSETGMSKVICYDAFPLGDANKEIISSRPGIRIDRQTLSAAETETGSGSKFTRTFLNEGIQFVFVFELNNYNEDDDFKKDQQQLENLIAAFAAGDILLGSNKTSGFGRFKVNLIEKVAYDLTNYEDMFRYLSKDTKASNITVSVLNKQLPSKNIRFKVSAKTTTPLLIKDEIIRSSDEPDGINIKNGSGDFIIPGTSLKGILRSRAEKLAKTFSSIDDTLITNIFGIESNDEDKAHISRLTCFDTKINDAKEGIYNKIKIDYFTGGVKQHALMQEETVMGDLEIECIINTFGLKNLIREVGLLLLVFRDLCTESLSVGGGYAVGRGYIKADTLQLIDGETFIYDFNSPDKHVEDKFNSYISELMI